MISPSRPLWLEYANVLAQIAAFALASSGALFLVQAALRPHFGPSPFLGDPLTTGEQISLSLRVLATLVPAVGVWFFVHESRLARRLQRAGRVPDASAVVLCGGGALWVDSKRVFGLLYATGDEFGFAGARLADRPHDQRLSLSAVTRVSPCRVTAFRLRAVRVHLEGGREVTLLPFARKTWAAWLERRRRSAA